MKRCGECGDKKELNQFYKENGKSRSACKACWNLPKKPKPRKKVYVKPLPAFDIMINTLLARRWVL